MELLAFRDCLEHGGPAARPLAGLLHGHREDHRGAVMVAAGSDFAFAGVTGAKPRGNVGRQLVPRPGPPGRVPWTATSAAASFDAANWSSPASASFPPAIRRAVFRECVALTGSLAIESD